MAPSKKDAPWHAEGYMFTLAHMFFNLQQKLQQNEGEGYWRMVADSD